MAADAIGDAGEFGRATLGVDDDVAEGLGERIPVRLLTGKERDGVIEAVRWNDIVKQNPEAVHLLACQQRLPAGAQMREIGLNLTIIVCLVAAVAAVDRPGSSIALIVLASVAWVAPGLWRIVRDLKEVRLSL